MKNASIDVIIPVWNDKAAVETHIGNWLTVFPAESLIFVFDEEEAAYPCCEHTQGIRMVRSTIRQRARQMNTGAALGQGSILLFLHADTRLPNEAAILIRKAVEGGAVGGAFSRRYEPPHWFLNLTCRLADWRGHWSGWFLGDQAIFIRRDIFEALGGYAERNAFEDLDLARRMRQRGPTRLVSPSLVSSSRRFSERGPIRQTWEDFLLTLRYLRKENQR